MDSAPAVFHACVYGIFPRMHHCILGNTLDVHVNADAEAIDVKPEYRAFQPLRCSSLGVEKRQGVYAKGLCSFQTSVCMRP